ncbi:MAG TPA: Gfo/Idh/MocA family oxidoreductase [Verrucomicrobiales bacterium]|jgi:predicted dehydrogenase|nr:Gfo/Idh/MocA family oxidoreductase [Verrucomicrobiales bacterium]
MSHPVRFALVGCGGFGRFCLSQFLRLEGLECAGVADLDHPLAVRTAADFGVKAWDSVDDLLADKRVDLVYLATPPFTHGLTGLAALNAGKHLLVEKPLAVTMGAASELVAASRARGLVLSVNLMMRHSPLCQSVKTLIDSNALGEPLHAHFVNDARDEILPPEHWFWDRDLSGGIFIEHGVHFFDLFEWWFGPGKVVAAQQLPRPGSGIIDQVNCTVVYRNSIFGNFYHGFHQADRRDQQEWLVVFENGTLRMKEWVPTTVEIDFVATQSTADEVAGIIPGARLEKAEEYTGAAAQFFSRHTARTADGRFLLTTEPVAKWDLYGAMVRSLMAEQVGAIRTPGAARLVTEANGLSSLAYAVEAQRIASFSDALLSP